ncbi:MAG: M67 family metallopeptidase [Proteobacteria bacterium]|nr:M67 family metallopeptidase [Pseudomonadota bacterium]
MRIPAADLAALAERAVAAAPLEACALLAGVRVSDTVTVTAVHAADNVAADPARGFEADPRVLLRLHRELRGRPAELVGVWHSHPGGGAELSATDLARAWDASMVWLLTPVTGGRAAVTTAHRVVMAGVGSAARAVAFAPLALKPSE